MYIFVFTHLKNICRKIFFHDLDSVNNSKEYETLKKKLYLCSPGGRPSSNQPLAPQVPNMHPFMAKWANSNHSPEQQERAPKVDVGGTCNDTNDEFYRYYSPIKIPFRFFCLVVHLSFYGSILYYYHQPLLSFISWVLLPKDSLCIITCHKFSCNPTFTLHSFSANPYFSSFLSNSFKYGYTFTRN